MTVTDYIVHRVVALEKAVNLKIGDVIPIPRERDDFNCTESKRITEQVFEEERKTNFSSYPSRKSCLFVLPLDSDIVSQWVMDYNPHNNYEYCLLTLRLDGDLIWCEEDTFTQAGILSRNRQELANKYWSSASEEYSSFETPEGLFVGRALVINIERCHYLGIN